MNERSLADYIHLTLRQVRAAQATAAGKNEPEHAVQEQYAGVEVWTKEAIRSVLRMRRRESSSDVRLDAGRKIAQLFYAHSQQFIQRVFCMAIYLSSAHEIPTRYLARGAWKEARKLCVPGWSQVQKKYRFYEINAKSRLIKGPQGIREPAERLPVDIREIDLFMIPGLAFDVQGGRIGYGGGNYDCLLARARPNAIKMAVAYDWQVVSKPLPLEAHDIRVDWIVTPTQLHCCRETLA